MEIVIARVRLLEILVESPPRVIAAWLVRVPPLSHPVLLQGTNCPDDPWEDKFHVEIIQICYLLRMNNS